MAKSKAKGRAQSGGTKKVVAIILAFLFLAACAFCGAGIGLRDKSSGKWYSTSTWYHNWGKSEKPGETGTKTSGAVISEGESNGIMLLSEQIPVEAYSDYGITRASAASYYSLSVTYTPENTTFQETDITINFKNPNSTWATGKNIGSYVTLNHANGDKQGTLYILKGFEEQIIVTARSQRFPDLYATATVDWLHDGGDCYIGLADEIDSSIVLDWVKVRGGTIAPDSENCIEIKFEVPGFANFMKSKGYYYVSDDQVPPSNTYSVFLSFNVSEPENDKYIVDGSLPTFRQIIIGLLNEAYSDSPEGSWNAACEFFLNGSTPESLSNSSIMPYTCYLHRNYKGRKIDVIELNSTDIDLADWSGFEVEASDITLKPGEVVGW